jgi:hypothetical protein
LPDNPVDIDEGLVIARIGLLSGDQAIGSGFAWKVKIESLKLFISAVSVNISLVSAFWCNPGVGEKIHGLNRILTIKREKKILIQIMRWR